MIFLNWDMRWLEMKFKVRGFSIRGLGGVRIFLKRFEVELVLGS